MGPSLSAARHRMPSLPLLSLALLLTLATMGSTIPNPWYQGDGLPDCAPGKCPKTAEISPIICSSDPGMYFNNGYQRNVRRARNATLQPLMLGRGTPAGSQREGRMDTRDRGRGRQETQCRETLETVTLCSVSIFKHCY